MRFCIISPPGTPTQNIENAFRKKYSEILVLGHIIEFWQSDNLLWNENKFLEINPDIAIESLQIKDYHRGLYNKIDKIIGSNVQQDVVLSFHFDLHLNPVHTRTVLMLLQAANFKFLLIKKDFAYTMKFLLIAQDLWNKENYHLYHRPALTPTPRLLNLNELLSEWVIGKSFLTWVSFYKSLTKFGIKKFIQLDDLELDIENDIDIDKFVLNLPDVNSQIVRVMKSFNKYDNN